MLKFELAKDFSEIPGGRYISEGNFSGEEFRKKHLKPLYEKAIKNNEKLQINLDNTYGYAPSFLEESFGGLVRELHSYNILDTIELISDDEPGLINEIKKYIKEAIF